MDQPVQVVDNKAVHALDSQHGVLADRPLSLLDVGAGLLSFVALLLHLHRLLVVKAPPQILQVFLDQGPFHL